MKFSSLEIKKRSRKIKLIISDVDGVLTDGGMYYGEKGEVMKKFNTRDGMGVEIIKNKIKVIFMTRENSKIVLRRAKKLRIDDAYIGIQKKEDLLPDICKKYGISKSEIAYIGDDINDHGIMKEVGFSIAPRDGHEKIKRISNYICKLNGGEGVFREVAELILSAHNIKGTTKKGNR